MVMPIDELMHLINRQIAEMEYEANEDIARYENNFRRQRSERWRRFLDETAMLKKERNHLLSIIAEGVRLTPPRIIITINKEDDE
jgi:hypothetical protein